MFKKILLSVASIFVIIQFFHPEKNLGNDQSKNIETLYPLSAEVKQTLEKSCYDCHSNNTVYPWYFNIQPVAWFLADHIEEAKHELNFSEYASYSLRRQFHKMEEIEDEVSGGEMPLSSYTLIHTDAKLDAKQKNILINWAKTIRDTMKLKYPIDSLVRKKK
jgi:Haem-binding domain